jgi:hypothetical protein
MTAVAQRSQAGATDIAEVERCHHALLESYVAALADASRAQRFAARKMVESHVKRRLEALAAIYTQTALVGSDRERYEALATDARAFADTLSMWRLATWIAVFPIAVALVGPVVSVFRGVSFDGWHADIGDVVVLGLSGVFLIVYVGGLLPRAFWRKRELLYPSEDRNAYAREEAAFTALGRGRPLEQRWDFVIAGVASGLLLLLGPVLVVVAALPLVDDVRDIPNVLLLAGYLPGAVAVTWMTRRARRREWR